MVMWQIQCNTSCLNPARNIYALSSVSLFAACSLTFTHLAKSPASGTNKTTNKISTSHTSYLQIDHVEPTPRLENRESITFVLDYVDAGKLK